MKKYSTLLFLVFVLLTCSAYSQPPNFDVYIANESYPTSNTYRFDIWVKKTGDGPLEIAMIQFGIDVNSKFRGSGTITAGLVKGSTMFVPGQAPPVVKYSNSITPEKDRINIPVNMIGACGTGTIMPDPGTTSDQKGIRFITIELTTSLKNWPDSVKPDLDFYLNPEGRPIPLVTNVWHYPQPCPSYSKKATERGTFYDYNSDPVLFTENPAAPVQMK